MVEYLEVTGLLEGMRSDVEADRIGVAVVENGTSPSGIVAEKGEFSCFSGGYATGVASCSSKRTIAAFFFLDRYKRNAMTNNATRAMDPMAAPTLVAVELDGD